MIKMTLKKKISKERTVYFVNKRGEGVPHTITECGKRKYISGEWHHCIRKAGHKDKHLYAFGSGVGYYKR